MCSIFGYVSNNGMSLKDAIHYMKFGENRGYEGCGVAFYDKDILKIRKCDSRCDILLDKLIKANESEIISKRLISHTRWPTSSIGDELNAHPHISENGIITLVHNGIIENAEQLKEKYKINTYGETDSEIAANVIEKNYLENLHDNVEKLIRNICMSEFIGSYAFAIIIKDQPGIFIIRNKSPLVIGRTLNDDLYLASHTISFPKEVVSIHSLQEFECIHLDKDNTKLNTDINWELFAQEEVSVDHDTLYEIKEQVNIPKFLKNDISAVRHAIECADKVLLIGCGTSYHACLYSKRQIEKSFKCSVHALIASEARYEDINHLTYDKNTVAIFISQSGETADTLECLRVMKSFNTYCISILNTNNSSMERESDLAINIGVGTEFCVASTKAYLGQCAFFNEVCEKEYPLIKEEIKYTIEPNMLETYNQLAKDVLFDANKIFFIGKLADYVQCKEGSLKMKELTYVPSEAYQAGELKHGPIAMIDDKSVIIAVCTYDNLASKVENAIQEVAARGAKVIIITKASLYNYFTNYEHVICIDNNDNSKIHADLLAVIPMQCLAYYLCKAKGYDDSKPRGIAKTVN